MHRDLNDIIPPSRRRMLEGQQPRPAAPAGMDMRPTPPPPAQMPPEHEEAVPPMQKPPKRSRVSRGFPIGTALIAVVVVAACAVILYAFAGAKVTVTPLINVATVAADMSATAGQGDLPFQVVTIQKTLTASVPAESTVNANDPATGKITITNQQAAPQALIKNTRFQTPEGYVFRIRDSVSIPAGGSLSVTVYADEAGEKYNIGPTTFTVPGLKGSKAFDLVSAKSAAAMSGGFQGQRPSVSDGTKQKQYADLQGKITDEMGKDLAAKIPEGYVLVPGASFTTYDPMPDTAGASGTVTLSEQGTMTVVLLPAEALARAIAFKSVGTYGGQPVTIKNVQNLVLKPVQPTLAPDATQFDFNLSGTANIQWIVEADKVASAVAGKNRSTAEIALKSLPEVDKATLVLRPFWASKFPGDPAKIKVTITEPASK